MKIGYIGIGLMGNPCCKNLLKHGYSLSVWARRPEAAEELIQLGATLATTPQELAEQTDIVFTNVTNASDVEELLFGPNGVAASHKQGLIVVDMSTISTLETKRFHTRLQLSGIEFVDAPVSGGTAGAQQGTLTFMVGATPDIFEKVKPVLLAMGSTVTRIGSCGAGQVAKSCNQIIITGTIAAIAEAFAMASSEHVDLAPIREALLGGFAGSKILEMHGKRIIDDNYAPGFKTALHLKDLRIVSEVAEATNLTMPITQYGLDLLQEAVENDYGQEDSTAIAKVIFTHNKQSPS